MLAGQMGRGLVAYLADLQKLEQGRFAGGPIELTPGVDPSTYDHYPVGSPERKQAIMDACLRACGVVHDADWTNSPRRGAFNSGGIKRPKRPYAISPKAGHPWMPKGRFTKLPATERAGDRSVANDVIPRDYAPDVY